LNVPPLIIIVIVLMLSVHVVNLSTVVKLSHPGRGGSGVVAAGHVRYQKIVRKSPFCPKFSSKNAKFAAGGPNSGTELQF